MFGTSVVVLAIGVLLIGPAAAAGGSPGLNTRTGDITRLGLARISVGGLTCEVPAASAVLSGNFAVGEKVTIDCIGDVLRLIGHHHHFLHVSAANGSNGSIGSNGSNGGNGANGSSVNISSTSEANGASSSTAVSQASTSGNSTATSISSSTDNSGTTTSVSAEGAVTAITPTTISIGQASCPFDRASYPAGSPVAQLQVGDVAKIDCKSYPDGTTTGTVSVP